MGTDLPLTAAPRGAFGRGAKVLKCIISGTLLSRLDGAHIWRRAGVYVRPTDDVNMDV
jgi:hypothetical protein